MGKIPAKKTPRTRPSTGKGRSRNEKGVGQVHNAFVFPMNESQANVRQMTGGQPPRTTTNSSGRRRTTGKKRSR